jgi:alkanesulfonate monooxygenase SsuD/methylene tetrahydromethanopterin reductase-like flavin-dependent oxidoreductase (luciferase family)
MKFALIYQVQLLKPWTNESEYHLFQNILTQVSFAEEMGFESVWFMEHHFAPEQSHSSAPDMILAALSQRTSRMRLGLAVVLTPVHHPLHTAERLATLDLLSGGRVELGVGRSGHPFQLTPFGVSLEDSRGMWEEALTILPKAWTEEVFAHQGTYYQIPPREVIPKPLQRPHPPLWGACNQEDTAYMTGKMGFGCLVITHRGAERAHTLIGIYKDAIRQADPKGKFVHQRVAANTLAYCGQEREPARSRGAELLDWYRNMQRMRDERNWQEVALEEVPADYKFHLTKGADARGGGEDITGRDLVDARRFCMGDPEDCIKFIEQFEAIGVEELMFNFQLGPVAHAEVMESIRLFGKQVMPFFKGRDRNGR